MQIIITQVIICSISICIRMQKKYIVWLTDYKKIIFDDKSWVNYGSFS